MGVGAMESAQERGVVDSMENELPRGKPRGIERPNQKTSRGKPRGIEPDEIKLTTMTATLELTKQLIAQRSVPQ